MAPAGVAAVDAGTRHQPVESILLQCALSVKGRLQRSDLQGVWNRVIYIIIGFEAHPMLWYIPFGPISTESFLEPRLRYASMSLEWQGGV